jgi:hypothetical protein
MRYDSRRLCALIPAIGRSKADPESRRLSGTGRRGPSHGAKRPCQLWRAPIARRCPQTWLAQAGASSAGANWPLASIRCSTPSAIAKQAPSSTFWRGSRGGKGSGFSISDTLVLPGNSVTPTTQHGILFWRRDLGLWAPGPAAPAAVPPVWIETARWTRIRGVRGTRHRGWCRCVQRPVKKRLPPQPAIFSPAPALRQGSSPARAGIGRSPSPVGAQRR